MIHSALGGPVDHDGEANSVFFGEPKPGQAGWKERCSGQIARSHSQRRSSLPSQSTSSQAVPCFRLASAIEPTTKLLERLIYQDQQAA